MSEKIKILYLSASPNDLEKLSVDEEFRAIYEKVDRNSFEMISVSGTRASDIQAEVVKNKPEIIHFSGHASADEVLFENDGKKSQGVSKNAIVNFLNDLDKKPRLIFFNACRTAENLESLSRIIDFVVATERAVFDTTAVIFATKFYEFLSDGKNVKTAFNHAKNEFAINPVQGTETREATFNFAVNESDIKNTGTEADMYKLLIRDGVDETEALISDSCKTDTDEADRVRNIYQNNFEGSTIGEFNSLQGNNIGTVNFNKK
jgi:hypothetical protein